MTASAVLTTGSWKWAGRRTGTGRYFTKKLRNAGNGYDWFCMSVDLYCRCLCSDKQRQSKAETYPAYSFVSRLRYSLFCRLGVILHRCDRTVCDNAYDIAAVPFVHILFSGKEELSCTCTGCRFHDLSSDIRDSQLYRLTPEVLWIF